MGTNNQKVEEEICKKSWVLYFFRFTFRFMFSILWRRKIIGHENIPKDGVFIVAPNHISLADPPIMGSLTKKPVYVMAKQELFDIPVIGFFIRRMNVFPIKRGKQDISAVRNVLKLLKSGKSVLMFPEGTRSKDGNFGTAKSGVGMISCMANVPVVPARIINSDKLSKFSKIYVIFGKPMNPPAEHSKESYQRFSEEILEAIKKLKIN